MNSVFGLAHCDWDGDHVEFVHIGNVTRAQEICDELNQGRDKYYWLEPIEIPVTE